MGDNRQNCLGFVTGIFGYDKLKELVPSQFINPELPTPKPPEAEPAVIDKMNELGFECRKVMECTPLNDGEELIAFWGLFPHTQCCFGQVTCSFDFHFAKHINGEWHHKWGWNACPTQTSIGELIKAYGQAPTFFGLTRKSS